MLMLVLIVAVVASLAVGLLLGKMLVTGEATASAARSGEVTGPAAKSAPAEAAAEAGRRPVLRAADGIVCVVPGGRRFHLDGCRLAAGKPAVEISLDEARDEGFTPCTSCIPDRQALPSPR